MNKFLEQWSFIIVPGICLALIFGSYKTLYPLLTYDVFPFQLPSLGVIKLVCLVDAILIPFAISKLYKLRFTLPFILWLSCTGLALILEKGVYEGNANRGLASFILPYQLFATFLTLALVVVLKRKSLAEAASPASRID